MVDDFRQRASTCYHPVGTCMMGADPKNSVVDANLKRAQALRQAVLARAFSRADDAVPSPA